MISPIKLIMHNKKAKVHLNEDELPQSTVKSVFLLPSDSVIALSYSFDGETTYCNMNREGTVFHLPHGWENMEFSIESNKTPSRPVTPSDTEGSSCRKRPREDPKLEVLSLYDDLVARISPYAWFYLVGNTSKRSAIPVAPKLAITYRHGENKKLLKGDIINLRSYHNQQLDVVTRVILINETLDLVVLQSDSVQLCDRNLYLDCFQPKKGMKYVMMGYSVRYGGTTHQSFSTGVIASDVTPRMRFLGSSGSFKGDSGGSCWTEDGRLIGMQVETENVPHTRDNSNRPASPATGGRCGIVPIHVIAGFMSEFLPTEDEWDFEE